MKIRAARESDAAAICSIWNPLIAGTAITFTTEQKTPAGIRADIAARAGAFLVAETGSELLGFATYFPFRNGPGYARSKELTINLAPQARRQGTGRALVKALEDHARGASVHTLWAAVSGENPAGVAFHETLGFQRIARLPEVGYKFGRWMDMVLLQKTL